MRGAGYEGKNLDEPWDVDANGALVFREDGHDYKS